MSTTWKGSSLQPRSSFLEWLTIDELLEVQRDADMFRECLEQARARAVGPAEGFFGPESLIWRIVGEFAVHSGSMRAVIMQLAHPAIAAAGVQSSNFRQDFIGRSWRTFVTMSELIFGDLESAAEASRRLHVLHARTRGQVPNSASPRRDGDRYRATDPALMVWVLATLFEGSMFTYENLISQLAETERAQYWDDMRLFGILLGLPPDAMPLTLADFWTYWHRTLAEELEVGIAARELAAFLVRSPMNFVPARLRSAWLERVTLAWTAGCAPRNWACALDIDPDGRAARDFGQISQVFRALLRALPPAFRRIPAYHQALLRVTRAAGARPPRVSMAVDWLNTRWPLPLAVQPLKALDADERRVLVELFDAS